MLTFRGLKNMIIHQGLEYFGKYYGIYRGLVGNNEDPDFYGRIQVIVPQIYGEDKIFKYWAWPKGAMAGNQIGMFAIPNKGDGIWVSFENGDLRFPVWEYGWWGRDEVPTAAKSKNRTKPSNMVFQSTSGHRIEMDDMEGEEVIRITDKHENIIEMNVNGVSIISEKVSFGTLDGSAEPSLLGDTTVKWLEDLVQALENVKVATSIGPQPFLNLPEFIALKAKLETLKSTKITLD